MRDVDSILEAVRPELESLERARQGLLARRWKVGKNIFITALVIFGLGSLIVWIKSASPGLLVLAGIAALIVAAIMLHVQIIVPTNRFKAEFKFAAIGAIVRAMEPGMVFSPQRGIPEDQFVRSGLFTEPDRYGCEDGLSGKIGDTTLRISEVLAEQKHERTTSKNRTETYYTTIFDGIFMVADFHKHFSGTTRVLPDTRERLLGGLGKWFQDFRPFSREDLVYLEDPEFEREFVVYGSDQIESRYILSTALARRILEIKRKWKNEVRLAFLDSLVFVAINHREDFFEPSIKHSALAREQVGQIASELALCFGLVEDLNLNTRIWSKS